MRVVLLTIVSVLWPISSVWADGPLRIATFNVSFNRRNAGDLIVDLQRNDPQAVKVARILRTVRPDIVLLNEVDFDSEGEAVRLFQQKYLLADNLPGSTQPLDLRFSFSAEVNTGVDSGHDFDNDGQTGGPADGFGFGWFPGQYGMVMLSRFPIVTERVRTFRRVLWKDMPEARRPVDPETGESWYSDEEWDVFRLSSKSHWDVPVDVDGVAMHVLAAHPTPPAFDGPEDRNGCRNADEIRFWSDYLSPRSSQWIRDDAGRVGGLPEEAHFCILGDLNADPVDGASLSDSIRQLLGHPRVSSRLIPQSEGARIAAIAQGGRNKRHQGPHAHDTADFSDRAVGNLRVDYVLPSRTLQVESGGVYWPDDGGAAAELIDCSDHRLVWIDVRLPPTAEE